MPSPNAVKESLRDGVYHVYNRGVERRDIFMDHHGYQRFKLQMRTFLERELNHFHLLVQRTDNEAMSRYIKRLVVGYVMYFNKKYHRVGPLFQGKYKAVRVIGPRQLMEVSRYIHLDPERAGLGWRQHQHSSIASYTREAGADNMVDPGPVLELFDIPEDYKRYMSIGEVRP
ncbi:MAG: hypothetical protein JWN01_627 [Patescibacteria group bacterium]|nr:hypothetical protein [Patescibacteria group bacterium]